MEPMVNVCEQLNWCGMECSKVLFWYDSLVVGLTDDPLL
jgi:hypothetical protein